MTGDTKVVALYLPQMHPVPENDAWWGRGFTEWTKVVAARPLGPTHYQPHLPADLGFYDLRVPEVRERQARMARHYGIHGFMYYHYWFGGHRVLDRTFREVLETGRPDFPFALCWANENWTRTWDAGERSVLLEQRYDHEERTRHIDWLIGAFRDPRYITVDGRPLFAVYRVQSLHDARGFAEQLREAAAAAGLTDPYLVKFDTHGRSDDPSQFGFDASSEFFPHGVAEHIPRADHPFGADSRHLYFDYREVVPLWLQRPIPKWTRHDCVSPSWDNTPRRQDLTSLIMLNSTPGLYEEWLSAVIGRSADKNGLVLINAWNEWGEGAHLEPDQRWGHEYLHATARAVLGRDVEDDTDRTDDFDLDVEQRPGAGFEELYLDVYDRYVRLRKEQTTFANSVRRETLRRTAALQAELADETVRCARLAAELERAMQHRGGRVSAST